MTQVERSSGRKTQLGFDLMVESALGLTNLGEIAGASPRIESLQFGSFDYAKSVRMATEIIGGPHQRYAVSGGGQDHWNDPYHYPVSHLAAIARAAGVRPIDGPYAADPTDWDADPDGYSAAAHRARVLGCDGKQALTPRQATLANTVFTPTSDEIERARAIIEASTASTESGVTTLNGSYLDQATIHAARDTVAAADAIAARA